MSASAAVAAMSSASINPTVRLLGRVDHDVLQNGERILLLEEILHDLEERVTEKPIVNGPIVASPSSSYDALSIAKCSTPTSRVRLRIGVTALINLGTSDGGTR